MTAPVDAIIGHVNVNPDTQAVLLVLDAEHPDASVFADQLRAVSEYLGVPVAAVTGVDHVCVVDR